MLENINLMNGAMKMTKEDISIIQKLQADILKLEKESNKEQLELYEYMKRFIDNQYDRDDCAIVVSTDGVVLNNANANQIHVIQFIEMIKKYGTFNTELMEKEIIGF